MLNISQNIANKRSLFLLTFIGIITLVLILIIGNLNKKQSLRSSAAGTAIDLSMNGPSQINQGTEFVVDLYADGTDMSGIGACVQPSDGSVLQIVSINSTGIFPVLLQPGTVSGNRGCITVGSSASAPLSGHLKYAEVHVQAVNVGSANVTYINTEAYDTHHTQSNTGQLFNSTFFIGRLIIPNPSAVRGIPQEPNIQVGTNTTVDIMIDTQQWVTAGRFCYGYNPAILQGISFQTSTSLPIVLEQGTFTNGQACITLGVSPSSTGQQGVTGQFEAVSITFQAIIEGMSPVTCGGETELAAVGFDGSSSLIGECSGSALTISTASVATPTSLPIPTIPSSSPAPSSPPAPTSQPSSIPIPTDLPTSIPTPQPSPIISQQIVPSSTGGPTGTTLCIADITGALGIKDNTVDLLDLNFIVEVWNDPTRNSSIDFNHDGKITIQDFNIFIMQFGCTNPA